MQSVCRNAVIPVALVLIVFTLAEAIDTGSKEIAQTSPTVVHPPLTIQKDKPLQPGKPSPPQPGKPSQPQPEPSTPTDQPSSDKSAPFQPADLPPKPAPSVDSPVIIPTPVLPSLPEKITAPSSLMEEIYVPDEALVIMPSHRQDRLQEIGKLVDLALVETVHLSMVSLVVGRYRIPEGRELFKTLDEITLILEGMGEDLRDKVFVQPNYYFEALGVNSIPYNIQIIRAHEAHSLATGRGVTIALLDTPVDTDHPAYHGQVQEDRKVIPNEKPGAHGTALAGVIVAKGDVSGVSPDVKLISIPVCRIEKKHLPRTTSLLLAQGLDLSMQKDVQVINLSLGGPKDSLIGLLIDEALKRKTVIVAAAGNSGPKGQPPYPATHNGVIAVTAIDHHDQLDPRATHGPHVSLSAPGVDIISTAPNGRRQVSTGTSLAAAHVSGIVALILERWPDVTPSFVKRLLELSAYDLGPSGKDSVYGAGRVDALSALEIGLSGKVKE